MGQSDAMDSMFTGGRDIRDRGLRPLVILAALASWAGPAAAFTPLAQDRSVYAHSELYSIGILVFDLTDQESAPDFGPFAGSAAVLPATDATQTSTVEAREIRLDGTLNAVSFGAGPGDASQAISNSSLTVSFQVTEVTYYDIKGRLDFEFIRSCGSGKADIALLHLGGADIEAQSFRPSCTPGEVCEDQAGVALTGVLPPGSYELDILVEARAQSDNGPHSSCFGNSQVDYDLTFDTVREVPSLSPTGLTATVAMVLSLGAVALRRSRQRLSQHVPIQPH
jgi:hypothetical protein